MTLAIQQRINEGPMSSFQMFVIGICVVINMLDGFDVLVVAFTASSIATDWSIPNSSLGIILSAGLFGMAAGSLFLAPYADHIGRRYMILVGLVIITIGMLASAFSQSVWQLVSARLFTGLGIGGLLASMNVLVAEYSSRKYRSLAISFLQSGYPIGATIGGSIVVILISEAGWRAAFLFGAVLSGLMIPLVFSQLPESLHFLVSRRPGNALQRINTILVRIGQQKIDHIPDPVEGKEHQSKGIALLLSGTQLRQTLLIWTSFFMLMFSFYFVLSWTPKLLVVAGLSTEQGISGSVLLNLGGIIGGLMLGVIATRVDLKRLIGTYMLTTSVLMVVFGLLSGQLTQALSVAIFLGFFLFGSMIGLYAITPALYATDVRTTGMGWAIGIGRIGAIIAPYTAGLLLDNGMGTTFMFIIFAVPMVFAALAQSLIKR
jgi:benzoate transport